MPLDFKIIGSNSDPRPPAQVASLLKSGRDNWYKVYVRGKPGEEDHVFTVKKNNKNYFWYDVNGGECFNAEHDHLSYRVARKLPKKSVYSMVLQENVPASLNCWKFDIQLERYFNGSRNIVSDAIVPIKDRFDYSPVN